VASLIGKDLTIIGGDLQIVTKGDLVVEGTVTGDILAADVQIGPEAVVTGLVNAHAVTVAGTVSGSIRAVKIALRATAKVSAEINHNSLVIEEGARYEGASRHSDDADTLAPDFASAHAGAEETKQVQAV